MSDLLQPVKPSRYSKLDPDAVATLLEVDEKFGKISIPCRIMVSGKSELILLLIQHRARIFNGHFDRILIALPSDIVNANLDYIDRMKAHYPTLEIVVGLPDLSKHHLLDPSEKKLLIIEDMVSELMNSKDICGTFTRNSHHNGLSLIFTSQNSYFPSTFGVSIRRQLSEFIIFYQKNDLQGLKSISTKLFGKSEFFNDAFNFLFEEFPDEFLKYLVIDVTNQSTLPLNLQTRTRIFPDESGKINPIFFFPSTRK